MSLLDRIKSMFSNESSPPAEPTHSGAPPTAPDPTHSEAAAHREPTPAEAAAAASAQPVTAQVEPVTAEPPAADVARSAAELDESEDGPETAHKDGEGSQG